MVAMSRAWTTRTTIEAAMRMHNPPHPGEVLRQLDQQLQFDLWHADRSRKKLHVRRLVAA
jgi:hypothetical protein